LTRAQTTNLDGESNLKMRVPVRHTAELTRDSDLAAFRGVVECPPPDEHIYKFDARLLPCSTDMMVPLSATQLLLQATHVRNTQWACGLAVYTGNQCKFGQNKRAPRAKHTRTDDFIDGVSASIFIFQLALVVVFGTLGNWWNTTRAYTMWYLHAATSDKAYTMLIVPARFLLLNSTMIPISLKLTMDICKLAYARFINADAHLWDSQRRVGAVANSTSLSEDLGQIQFVPAAYVCLSCPRAYSSFICAMQIFTFGQNGHTHGEPHGARGGVRGGGARGLRARCCKRPAAAGVHGLVRLD
jgi:magnesium-transporting ATPase (P-type)